ncbi:MAG: aminotransferase class I/II-fold pyridoxal phosphate-dependent enzyme, partial [Victivallales bacterium]
MKDSKFPHNKIAEHIRKIPRSGIREFFELVIGCDDVISLGVGEPDFVTPWTIRESAIYSLDQGHTSYTSNQGLLSLRREICNYVNKDFGVAYVPETECLVTVGVSEALDLAMRALVNPGDEVIYSEPCYVSYGAEIQMVHGVPVVIENTAETEFSLDIEQLKAKITPKTKILM